MAVEITTIVGREAELRVIEEALDALAAGHPDGLVITGELGVGKSRLLGELAMRAVPRRVRVLRGGAAELERDMPYAVAIDVLDRELERLEPDELRRLRADRVAELGRIFPALETPVGGATVPRGAERHRLHAAIVALLERLAAAGPLALLLDDLHCADDASLGFVAHLLRRPPRGVLPVLAFRSGEAPDALLRALGGSRELGRLTHLELAPLDDDAAVTLLDDIDGRRRREILRQSGGNPFYLLELAEATRTGRAMSATLRMSVLGELSHVSDHGQELLRAAAVIGDPFDPELAAAIAPLDAAAGVAATQELVARSLVRATDEPRRFRFRQPVVRAVVHDWAGSAWSVAAHARAAEALSRRGAPAGARALHLERSARPGDLDAVAVLAEAGRSVAPRAPVAAARWFGAALRLLPHDAEPGARLALLAARALALVSTGQRECAREALLEALRILPPELTPERAELLARLARVENMLEHRGAACSRLQGALVHAGDQRAATALRIELAVARWNAAEWRLMARDARAALDGARELGDAATQVRAAALLALGEQQGGYPTPARSALYEAERLMTDVGDDALSESPDTLLFLAHANGTHERYDAMAHHCLRLVGLARRLNQEHFAVLALIGLTAARIWTGRLQGAVDAADEAVESALALDDERSQMWALGQRTWLAAVRGDVSAALRDGERASRLAARFPESLYAPMVACFRGLAHLTAGEPATGVRTIVAREAAGAQLERLEPSRRPHWAAKLAEAELARGREGAARWWLDRAAAWADASDLTGGRADVDRVRALVALAHGDACATALAAREAETAFGRIGRDVDAARAMVLHGRALALGGNRCEAVVRLRHAHALFAAAGAAHAADESASALRGLGERVGRSGRRGTAVRGVAALSAREREIGELVTQGLTNRQIAGTLFLSPKTVESHLTRIFSKLGASTRAAVAAELARDSAPV